MWLVLKEEKAKKERITRTTKRSRRVKINNKNKKILRKLTLIWGYKWNRGRRIKWKS